MKLNSLLPLVSFLTCASLPPCALANVEKTIFIAPPTGAATPLRPDRPLAQHFAVLPTLTGAETPALRMDVQAEFPTELSPSGAATWILLDEMAPGQRYEARVMWSATNPTAFKLDTFPLAQVVDDEGLFSSYANYAMSRANSFGPSHPPRAVDGAPASKLLLRVMAEAEYFTDDEGLMERVRPVPVDIYLDPFIFNAVPLSLLPVILLITLGVPVFWMVAEYVCRNITDFAQDGAVALGEPGRPENPDKNLVN